jgi:hypothetical protein
MLYHLLNEVLRWLLGPKKYDSAKNREHKNKEINLLNSKPAGWLTDRSRCLKVSGYSAL